MLKNLLFAGALLLLGTGAVAQAQQANDVGPIPTEEPTWYDDQEYASRPTPRSIIQQKAQYRAQQRLARMASLEWYGMSNARPTASPTPFTGMYSPRWQMPGGRPFAWYPTTRSFVVVR